MRKEIRPKMNKTNKKRYFAVNYKPNDYEKILHCSERFEGNVSRFLRDCALNFKAKDNFKIEDLRVVKREFTIRVGIRFTESDFEKVKSLADKFSQGNISSFIRYASLKRAKHFLKS